eukprot:scaffold30416_cov24-Cyclotella_meneghiniana.AAC.3
MLQETDAISHPAWCHTPLNQLLPAHWLPKSLGKARGLVTSGTREIGKVVGYLITLQSSRLGIPPSKIPGPA